MTESRRILELDGVRGCAIGLVLVFHLVINPIDAPSATFWHYTQVAGRLTWTGVDLFFVLSGFLIGGILLDARNSSNYFRAFYTRRFFRIVPLYVLLLGIVLMVNGGLIDNRIPTLSYFAFLQNFWMARSNTLGVFLAATWSLAVEEQFYITLPSAVRVLDRRRLVQILTALVFLAPCLRIFFFHQWPGREVVTYVITPCRGDTLLLGVLGAIAVREPEVKNWIGSNGRALLLLLLISGIAVALLTFVPPHGLIMISAGYPLIAAFYLLLILYAVTQPSSWVAWTMRQSWLRWLGSIAYGLYLVHQLMSMFVFKLIWHSPDIHLQTHANVATMVLVALLTLMICHLSYTYFEKPLLRFGHRVRYDS